MINKYLAELMGTFILVGLGSMGILAADAVGETGAAKLILVSLAFGLALLAGIWAVGHVSGAHFNPAVTLSMLLDGRISLGDAIGYWVAQFTGGVLGSLMILAVSGSRAAVEATGTYYESYTTGLTTEIVLTAVFAWVIMAVVKRGGNHAPLAIAMTLVGIQAAGIPFSGASVNPARSFGPAVVSGFSDPDIWLYLYAPLIGAVVAFALYRLFTVEDAPAT